MRTIMPQPPAEEEQQQRRTPPKFKDGRLTINVEVWYNLLPTMGCDVGAVIKNNLEKFWPELDRKSFPWDIYYKEEDVELEDDNNYYVRVMLQFKPGKNVPPIKDETSRLCAIQSLCKTLLDTTQKPFAEIPSLGRALNWKPSTRDPLSLMSWDDRRFGAEFCLQVLASIDYKTLFPKSSSQSSEAARDPETKYFGPRQSMLLFEDFKILFEPQISHLQEIFPGEHINPVTGMTQNSEDTVLYILKSCVSTPNDNPPVPGDNLITAFPAHMIQNSTQLSSLDTDRLESELKGLVKLYKINTMETTGGVKRLFHSINEMKGLEQGALLKTMKNLNTSMQLTTSLYQGSKELESRHSKKLWEMGFTTARNTGLAVAGRMGLPAALATAEAALAEAGFSTTAALIAEMGFASAGSSSTLTIVSGAAAASTFSIIALTILVPAAIAMVKVWKEKKRAENGK